MTNSLFHGVHLGRQSFGSWLWLSFLRLVIWEYFVIQCSGPSESLGLGKAYRPSDCMLCWPICDCVSVPSLPFIVYHQFILEEQLLLHSLCTSLLYTACCSRILSGVVDYSLPDVGEPVLSLTDGSNVELMKMSLLEQQLGISINVRGSHLCSLGQCVHTILIYFISKKSHAFSK